MQLRAITGVLLCLVLTAANATVCPNLHSAINYTVIAATTITNTGNTVITGSVASEIFTNYVPVPFIDEAGTATSRTR